MNKLNDLFARLSRKSSGEKPKNTGRAFHIPVWILKPTAAALLVAILLGAFSVSSAGAQSALPVVSEEVVFSNELAVKETDAAERSGEDAADVSAVPIDVYLAAGETMELSEKPDVVLEYYTPELERPEESPFTLINEAPPEAAPLDVVVGSANYQYQYGSIGWLNIPGTSINNAVMQARNNDYYLYRNEAGVPSSYGCYFADYECTFGPRSALSNNTVIYGHHIDTGIGDAPNGIRFGQLFNYRNASFAYSHPYIYFSTAAEKMTWQVFAVFYVNLATDRQVNIVRGDASSLANYGISRSMFNFGVSVNPGDKILTLYTCSYRDGSYRSGRSANIRFIVMAKLV